MKAALKYILCTLLLATWSLGLYAQMDPCLSYLKDAQEKTDEGNYDDAIALSQKAIEDCGFSKNDLIEAHKLLISNYIGIDLLEEAEHSAAQIMKLNPNHEPDRLRDPAAVIAIFKKYRPAPVLNGYLHGGINSSRIAPIQTFSIVGPNDTPGLDNYTSQTGWQLGAGIEYRIWKNLWIVAEGQYRRSRFSHRLDSVQGQEVDYNERLGFFDLNLGGRYYLGKGKIQAYGEGGFHAGFLINSLAEISRSAEFDLVDRTNQRSAVQVGYWLGAGMAYSHKSLRFMLGVRYSANPENLVNPEARFDNLGIVFKYYYLDNDFSMNHLQFRAGIAYTLRYRNMLQTSKQP